MDRLDFNKPVIVERKKNSSKAKSSKGRWREIEAIRDKIELQKELQDIDMAFQLENDFN